MLKYFYSMIEVRHFVRKLLTLSDNSNHAHMRTKQLGLHNTQV